MSDEQNTRPAPTSATAQLNLARCEAGCWESSEGTFMRNQKAFMGEGPLPCPDCDGTGRAGGRSPRAEQFGLVGAADS